MCLLLQNKPESSRRHPLFMKQILLALALFLTAMSLNAQTDSPARIMVCPDSLPEAEVADAERLLSPSSGSLALSLPWSVPMNFAGYGLDGCHPAYGGLYGPQWRLHEGFNAQLGLSVSAAFGKHAPKGVGFGQHAAFAYVLPLTSRLSVAAGIYAGNLDWGPWRQTDVGISGILAYRLTDRINLYAYGSKSFLPRQSTLRFRPAPFPIFMERVRDRIGAAAEFKIGNNATIGVSVEHCSY